MSPLSHPRAELNLGVWSPNKATARQWAEGIQGREQAPVLAKPPPQLDLLLQDLKILSIYHVFIVNFILLLTGISSFGYKNNVSSITTTAIQTIFSSSGDCSAYPTQR